MEANERELKMKLYQKIWAVMGAVNFVKKDGEVNFGESYKYATEAAIKKAVHAALVEHRLLFLPKKTDLIEQSAETVQDKYGKPKRGFRSTVDLHYEFIDIDTGYGEPFSIHGAGSGSDEKSIYKAFTGAYKYAFHLSLSIPTGDDPEKEELSREEKKELKAAAHAEQQRIAEEKMAQIQAGNVPQSWDWRNALGLYEQYEQRFGKEETKLALLATGLNSLEQTQSREHATEILGKIKKLLIHPGGEPDWARTKAKPESTLEKASGAVGRIASHIVPAQPADPVQEMLERMRDFKSRLAVIQQHKFDLVQKYGQKDGERRYYEVLDKQGGHPDTHANEIAKNAEKSRATAGELYLELHPEAVEEEVTA
jgi:hypothetical protein